VNVAARHVGNAGSIRLVAVAGLAMTLSMHVSTAVE